MYISSKSNKVQNDKNVAQSDVVKGQDKDLNDSKRHRKD